MITLRQLKGIVNRIPERSLDLRLAIERTEDLTAPYAYLNPPSADDGEEGQLVVMGTISCGPMRLEPEVTDAEQQG